MPSKLICSDLFAHQEPVVSKAFSLNGGKLKI